MKCSRFSLKLGDSLIVTGPFLFPSNFVFVFFSLSQRFPIRFHSSGRSMPLTPGTNSGTMLSETVSVCVCLFPSSTCYRHALLTSIFDMTPFFSSLILSLANELWQWWPYRAQHPYSGGSQPLWQFHRATAVSMSVPQHLTPHNKDCSAESILRTFEHSSTCKVP